MNYFEFLAAREQLPDMGGFIPGELPSHLFDYQAQIVDWAVRQGRGGIFADCGLGKTPMSLAWAEQERRVIRVYLAVTGLFEHHRGWHGARMVGPSNATRDSHADSADRHGGQFPPHERAV